MIAKTFKRIEEEVERWSLPYFVENTIIGLIAFFMATFVHEFGHFITALVLGCKAGISHVGMISGATSVSCATNIELAIVSLAGPLFAFLFGLWIWFSNNPNSRLRILSIILFTLSSTIQLIPVKPLDGWQAIQFGLPSFVEMLIFLTVFSVSVNLIIDEIRT